MNTSTEYGTKTRSMCYIKEVWKDARHMFTKTNQMTDKDIKQEIKRLRSKLTGEMFKDMKTHQEIYDLKRILNPEIENNPELDQDDECLACGS